MKKFYKVFIFLLIFLSLCQGCNKKSLDIEVKNEDSKASETGAILDHTNDPLLVEDVGIDTEFFEDNENDVLYNRASCDILMLPERYAEKYKELNDVIEANNKESVNEAKNFIQEYKAEIRQMRSDRNDNTLELSFENIKSVNRIDDLVFSYNEDISTYTGGAHGSYAIIGKNYEPKDGKEITSDDIFVDKNKLKEVLIERIASEYGENLFDDWKDTLNTHFEENMPFNISIGPSYVEIIFDTYYFAPYATGIVSVMLLYDDYKDLINKKYFK